MESLAKFWSQGSGRPHPPTHASRHQLGNREAIAGRNGTATGPETFDNLADRGEPLAKCWSPGTGDGRHRSTPPPPPYPPRDSSPPSPPTYGSQPHTSPPPCTPGFQTGEWLPQGEGGQQARAAPVTEPEPATGLAALGLTQSDVHAIAAALQGVVANGVAAALPSPHPVWTDRESGDPVPSAPPLCVRGGSGCRPPPHLGVGRLGTRQDGRACQPKPGPG